MSATDQLLELLGDDWRPATEVSRAAESLGLTLHQVRRARESLGVTRLGGGVSFRGGHWHWRRPPRGCPLCGRSWRPDVWDPWVSRAGQPPAPVTPDDEHDEAPEPSPSAPTSQVTQRVVLEPLEPARCDVCGSVGRAGERCVARGILGAPKAVGCPGWCR